MHHFIYYFSEARRGAHRAGCGEPIAVAGEPCIKSRQYGQEKTEVEWFGVSMGTVCDSGHVHFYYSYIDILSRYCLSFLFWWLLQRFWLVMLPSFNLFSLL